MDDAKAAARGTTPRKLARTLRGDLDTIILTALRVKLEERYRTADALALDIEHYLEGRAVNARPESWWESTRRFVLRHKVAVASAALVLVALTGGIAVATWQAAKARASEQRALAAAATSDAVKDFMIRIFETNTLRQEDAAKAHTMNALQLLEAGADRLATQFKGDPVVHRELLTIILRLLGESRSTEYKKHALEFIALLEKSPGTEVERADIYHELSIMEQGKNPPGVMEYAKAGLAVLGDSKDAPHRKARANLLSDQAVAYKQLGDPPAAVAALLEAKKLYEDGFANTAEYGRVLGNLGWFEMREEHSTMAVEYFEQAMRATLADPTSYPPSIAQNHGDLSIGYGMRRRYADAERELREAANLYRKAYGPEDTETALATARAAKAMTQQNRYDEAIALLKPAVAILDKPSPNAVPEYIVAGHDYLSDALMQSGRASEAIPEIRRVLQLAAQGSPAQRGSPLFIAAENDALRGKTADAAAHARAAVEIIEKTFGATSKRTLRAHTRMGRVLFAIGRADEADALFQSTLKAEAANAASVDSPYFAASIQHARVQIARGQASAALPALQAALKVQLAQPANQQDLNDEIEIRLALGRALTETGRAAEALPHLERVLALRQPQFAASPRLAEAQIALAECKLRLGDIAGAKALVDKARVIHAANRDLGEQYRAPLREVGAHLATAVATALPN